MTEQEWLTSNDPQEMLRYPLLATEVTNQYAGRTASDRKLRLFACACYRAIGRENSEVQYCEEIAEGRVKPEPGSGLRSLKDTKLLALASLRDCMYGYGRMTKDVGAALLRDIFGNPFRPVVLTPEEPANVFAALNVLGHHLKHPEYTYLSRSVLTWNDNIIPKLAQTIYNERCFEDMLVLADALEEAGCDNLDVVWHLRGWGRCSCLGMDDTCTRCVRNNIATGMVQINTQHVRGCWVLDLLLGKE